MSSVRNRILQFQQNDSSSSSSSLSSSTGSNNYNKSSPYGRSNGSIPPDIVATTNGRAANNQFMSKNSYNGNSNSNGAVNTATVTRTKSSFPYTSPTTGSTQGNSFFGNTYGTRNSGSGAVTNGQSVNVRKFSGNFSDSSSGSASSSQSSSLQSTWRGRDPEKKQYPELSTASIVRTVEIPLLKSAKSSSPSGSSEEQYPTPPIVNRANKPALAMKKASMTINLSSMTSSSLSSTPSPPGGSSGATFGGSSNGMTRSRTTLESPTRSKSRTPTRTSPSSSIPKLNTIGGGVGIATGGYGNGSAATAANTVRYRDPSPGGIGRRMLNTPASNRTTPATTPTGSSAASTGVVAFGSTFHANGTSTMGRFYQNIGWKEKFEESEKKKNHLVTLAQRATRDYEELRRRYHDLYTDHEKIVARFESANGQLESLRKASEATYDEYHKLKRRYECENQEKSDALTRVDEYNKENRRLKRQSALMMQQIDPSALLANPSLFETVPEGESAESDKEIQYLRGKVKDMEAKIIELEAELERIRLSEFESQESVLLMNDSIQTSKSENLQLRDQLRKLDEENRRLARSLEDLTLAHDSLKQKQTVDDEKLLVAETELKKLLTEKNILQRQSLVFMNNEEMDNRLLDALAQIGDLQRTVEEQKNAFESQITELQGRLSERELEEETADMQHNAKIKALEEEILLLRQRAEEAELKLEDCPQSCDDPAPAAPPPPPPPPPPMGLAAPPPPPPPPSFALNGGGGLGNSLQAAMGGLKKGNRQTLDTSPNGSIGGDKNLVSAVPQIDDIVSQLKQGIKLRHIDRTVQRKQPPQEKTQDDNPVDQLRSVLDNMRRTRTVERRF